MIFICDEDCHITNLKIIVQRLHHDKHLPKLSELKVGQKVLRHCNKEKSIDRIKWLGPFHVIGKALLLDAYDIQDMNGVIEKNVSRTDLVEYVDEVCAGVCVCVGGCGCGCVGVPH